MRSRGVGIFESVEHLSALGLTPSGGDCGVRKSAGVAPIYALEGEILRLKRRCRSKKARMFAIWSDKPESKTITSSRYAATRSVFLTTALITVTDHSGTVLLPWGPGYPLEELSRRAKRREGNLLKKGNQIKKRKYLTLPQRVGNLNFVFNFTVMRMPPFLTTSLLG